VNCEQCGEPIPPERILAAQTRNREPKYCSIVCRSRAAARRQRQKRKAAE